MSYLSVGIDKDIEYTPERKKRVFSQKKRVAWPFDLMESGDSFLIPEGYSLQQVFGAFSRTKKKNSRLENFGIRSTEKREGIRVWIFSEEDLLKFPSLN